MAKHKVEIRTEHGTLLATATARSVHFYSGFGLEASLDFNGDPPTWKAKNGARTIVIDASED